ncbi:hypothetical protein HAZT_HAZT009400, partial [Hyalella azteca]
HDGSRQRVRTKTVADYFVVFDPGAARNACPGSLVKCNDGENEVPCDDHKKCILKDQLCDGELDCDDDSDEKNCSGTYFPLTTDANLQMNICVMF